MGGPGTATNDILTIFVIGGGLWGVRKVADALFNFIGSFYRPDGPGKE